jgi:hypothetical protein
VIFLKSNWIYRNSYLLSKCIIRRQNLINRTIGLYNILYLFSKRRMTLSLDVIELHGTGSINYLYNFFKSIVTSKKLPEPEEEEFVYAK